MRATGDNGKTNHHGSVIRRSEKAPPHPSDNDVYRARERKKLERVRQTGRRIREMEFCARGTKVIRLYSSCHRTSNRNCTCIRTTAIASGLCLTGFFERTNQPHTITRATGRSLLMRIKSKLGNFIVRFNSQCREREM